MKPLSLAEGHAHLAAVLSQAEAQDAPQHAPGPSTAPCHGEHVWRGVEPDSCAACGEEA
jgi:hypothetical protein